MDESPDCQQDIKQDQKIPDEKEQSDDAPLLPETKEEEIPKPPTMANEDDDSEPTPGTYEHTYTYQGIEGPLFIRSDDFQRVLGRISDTKEILKAQEERMFKINEIKNKEEKKFVLWKNKLEDIQRKMIYVDKTLFENT